MSAPVKEPADSPERAPVKGPATGPLTTARAAGAGAFGLLLVTWWGSGSFLLGLLVVVLVGGTAGGAWLFVAWTGRGARGHDRPEAVLEALPTADLAPPSPGERVRRALRSLLHRPWVHGDGLVRAAARRLTSEEAMVWTPRGQRVAAPHLWVELHPDDLADVAARWPLEVLADELLSGYLEHARDTGARRLAQRTYLHLLPGADVPVGRVVVTAAFSRPAADPVATVSATEPTSSSVASPPPPSVAAAGPARPAAIAALPGPRPAVPGAAGRPGRAHLPPPPRPAPARGPAGDSRDSVGGSRGPSGGGRREPSRGDAAPTVAAPTGAPPTVADPTVAEPTGATVTARGRGVMSTLVQRVLPGATTATARATARATAAARNDPGPVRRGVTWRQPAGPRRGGGG